MYLINKSSSRILLEEQPHNSAAHTENPKHPHQIKRKKREIEIEYPFLITNAQQRQPNFKNPTEKWTSKINNCPKNTLVFLI